MKILPPRTRPPRKPTARRHRPEPSARWSAYRACLRWDFGFTCAFCLLHETDLFGGQTGEGLGGTTVEHAVARSRDASRAADYENCLYACRFCNRSRSALPRQRGEHRLLDPTQDAWGEHFEPDGDRLRPRGEDGDAEYTHLAYDLDDPRKVERRRVRRELIGDRLRLLQRLDGEISEILRLAGRLIRDDPAELGGVLAMVRRLRGDARRALLDLRRYALVPEDAPRACRCPSPGDRSLPEELERQAVSIPDPRP